MKMTNDEVRVFLEYTKVLLAKNKLNDAKVDEALDIAINSFGEDHSDEIYMFYKIKGI